MGHSAPLSSRCSLQRDRRCSPGCLPLCWFGYLSNVNFISGAGTKHKWLVLGKGGNTRHQQRVMHVLGLVELLLALQQDTPPHSTTNTRPDLTSGPALRARKGACHRVLGFHDASAADGLGLWSFVIQVSGVFP